MKHSIVRHSIVSGVLFFFLVPSVFAQSAKIEKHVVVFAEEGKFAGWPASHGAWSWDHEILVGFSVGSYTDKDGGHAIDRDKPEHHVLARSLDGGETWQLEQPQQRGMLVHLGGMRKGITDPSLTEAPPTAITKPINFAHPNFCMTLRLMQNNGGFSRLYYSYDRGHTWAGPIHVPSFGQPGVMARTDYIVNGEHDCHVFLTAAKSDNREGRVFSTRTTDGGMTWKMQSFVGPEPKGFAIMPSTVRVSSNELVMCSRRRSGPDEQLRQWIDVWKSDDNGESWRQLKDAVEDVGRGNPPSLIKLKDDRLCLTYGVRKPPYQICAKFSTDNGESWSSPIVLQTDGGGWDVGYPRTVQRPNGRIVTTYYFQTRESPYPKIMATIWNAGSG